MKCIRRLSGVALGACITFNSATAMSKGTELVSSHTSSAQALPVIVAQNSSSQVVDKDDKPKLCRLQVEGKTEHAICNAFKLMKHGEIHAFTFYFGRSPIAFISVPVEPEKEVSLKTFGQTFGVGQLHYNGKTQKLDKPGVCIRFKNKMLDSTKITCVANNFEIRYDSFFPE